MDEHRSVRLGHAGLAWLSIMLLAGCAAPAIAPGKEAAPPGTAAAGTATTSSGARGAAAPTVTPSDMNYLNTTPPPNEFTPDQMVDETIVNLDERIQAVERRMASLEGPRTKSYAAEVEAMLTDLRALSAQIQFAVGHMALATPTANPSRREKLSAIMDRIDTVMKHMQTLAAAGTDASVAAALKGIDQDLQAMRADLVGAPTAATTATP
jgi:hypothetical protein